MTVYLAYSRDYDKQTLPEQLALALSAFAEKYQVTATVVCVPVGYGAQVPKNGYTVEERRELHDREIYVGPIGE